jgi:hypothetical protein
MLNLVSYEYVACQNLKKTEGTLVLLLSELEYEQRGNLLDIMSWGVDFTLSRTRSKASFSRDLA